jgi:GNAT superfamily N-acetyltransferase
MERDIIIKAPDEAERLEAIEVFLRSFRNESESSHEWLDHFTRLLIDARLAHLLIAREGSGRGKVSGGAGTVVGCGALVCLLRASWIALMGVEPGSQKRGIGDALMSALMEHAADLGYKTVKLDATNFGRGLYAKHGFVDEYFVTMYEIPPRCDLGEEAGPVVRLDEELPEWCLALDREATGDDRRALLRAALADGAKVLMVDGQGFGIMHGRKVGPIIAGSLDAAIAIVRRADSFGVNRIYVPHHPELPEGFLAGLKEVPPRWELRCCTRMIYGEPLKQNLSLEYAGYSAATG